MHVYVFANNSRRAALCIRVVCLAVRLSIRPSVSLTSILHDAISLELLEDFSEACEWALLNRFSGP